MLRLKNNNQAFTLIEMLIVIAIIGLLSSIVLSTARGAQNKAAASRILSAFQIVEKGLLAYAIETGQNEWWQDEYFRSFGHSTNVNIKIEEILENLPEVEAFIPEPPTKPLDNRPIYYDADIASATGDCGSVGLGVNLIYYTSKIDLVQEVDKTHDNEDGPNCGTIRYWLQSNGTDYGVLFRIANDTEELSPI